MDQKDRDVLLEVRQDVKEIKSDISELKVGRGIDHHILKEHEMRSTASEGRLDILEKDVGFARRFIAVGLAAGGCWEVARYFLT